MIDSSYFDDHKWYLSSRNIVNSKDLRDHIDWLMEKLIVCAMDSKQLVFNKITASMFRSVKLKLVCFWQSKYGDSGPTLWTEQMQALADFGVDCAFNIYYTDSENDDEIEDDDR